MIAFAESNSTNKPAWHDAFVAMLPSIRDRLRFAFRGFPPEARQEATSESLALALCAFVRLFELGKTDIAYPSVLAMYAARHYRAGRRVGGPLNRNDILSKRAQRHHNLIVKRLDRRDDGGDWREVLVEDKTCTPAETAIARLDFSDWLTRLTHRHRRIATTLANGESTCATARLMGITAGRISQVRTELRRNWARFQGEPQGEASELTIASC